MKEPEHEAEARRWLEYATQDLDAARTMVDLHCIMPRHVCWFAQQAAEKALKAVLILEQIDFPKRHDLDMLRNLVPDEWQLKRVSLDLSALTEWAVEARYPGDWPEATEDDARAAVECAQAVWNVVVNDLVGQRRFR